jgi:hypothetical protein
MATSRGLWLWLLPEEAKMYIYETFLERIWTGLMESDERDR